MSDLYGTGLSRNDADDIGNENRERHFDHDTYGERYRFCTRHLLKVIHAMGDPETPVRSLDALIAKGDPEGVIESYIEALLLNFERGGSRPVAEVSPCGKFHRVAVGGRATPWFASEAIAWEHFNREPTPNA